MRAIQELCLNRRSSNIQSTIIVAVVSGLVVALTLCAPMQAQEAAQTATTTVRPLITEAVDEARLTTLKGNTHPLARPEFDLGTAPADLPMQRMLLVLKRGPDQETALRKLLDDQQDKSVAELPQVANAGVVRCAIRANRQRLADSY